MGIVTSADNGEGVMMILTTAILMCSMMKWRDIDDDGVNGRGKPAWRN